MENNRSAKEFVEEFNTKYEKMWWNTSSKFPGLFTEKIEYTKQLENEKKLDTYIRKITSELEKLPLNEEQLGLWRKKNGEMAIKLGKEVFGMNDKLIGILSSNSFEAATKDFLKDAREFDPGLGISDIFQAIRNVWIMNCIQLFFNMGLQHTPSIFAYSMLYPYTDNYLDDSAVSIQSKTNASDRLYKRLAGKSLIPENSHEQAIFRLVSMIEKQYGRLEFPDIYQSLLGIHKAQTNSLMQQGEKSPYETDILGISIEKGGTSVLADAYLVKGSLSKNEADFMYGFGVFLQFSDDLQDAFTDIKQKHMTIFSQTAACTKLDKITNRLINFMCSVIDSDKTYSTRKDIEIKELIKFNCTFLILQAVAQNSCLFSKAYLKKMEEYSTLRFAYLKNLYKKLQRKYKALKRKNKNRELDDLILNAL